MGKVSENRKIHIPVTDNIATYTDLEPAIQYLAHVILVRGETGRTRYSYIIHQIHRFLVIPRGSHVKQSVKETYIHT